MKEKFKRALAWLVFALSGGGDIATEAVNDGLCDFSGQGKNKYGR